MESVHKLKVSGDERLVDSFVQRMRVPTFYGRV
jgi:hypothetical protein